MNFRTRRTASASWLALSLFLLVFGAAVAAYTEKPASRTAAAAATILPQDVTRIESRLSLLEQRFYSIETTIRGLEQQSRLSSAATGRATRDPEVGLLRAEVETLRQRLAEIECGLARVDERTLTPPAKEARRKSGGAGGDPCRLNADAPLRLSARP